MQTFLPVADFQASAEMLDDRRLGKQRLEALQLIRALTSEGGGWSSHPAAHMWSQNLSALMRYHDVCIAEWIRRGFKNTMQVFVPPAYVMPPWFGDDRFHSAHRAALLFKDERFYRRYDWREEPCLNYLWPSYTGHGPAQPVKQVQNTYSH